MTITGQSCQQRVRHIWQAPPYCFEHVCRPPYTPTPRRYLTVPIDVGDIGFVDFLLGGLLWVNV